MKRVYLLFILLFLSLGIQACTKSTTSTDFIYSSLGKDFPIPSQSVEIVSDKNVVKYSLKGLKEVNGIPKYYLNEIIKKGWKEIDQLGASREFERNGIVIALITKNDYFSLVKVKE